MKQQLQHDDILAPLNDESAASHAFSKCFIKTESPSISLFIMRQKPALGIVIGSGQKSRETLKMSVVPLRGPRTPAESLALSDWSGVGVSE